MSIIILQKQLQYICTTFVWNENNVWVTQNCKGWLPSFPLLTTELHLLHPFSINFFLKVWWHDATLFVYFSYFFITYIHSFSQSHSFNTFIHRHSLRPLSISSSLVCSVGKHLPVVPRRESTSGLPYSKPTRYQLSHAAPYQLSHAAPLIVSNYTWIVDIPILYHCQPLYSQLRQVFFDLVAWIDTFYLRMLITSTCAFLPRYLWKNCRLR